MRIPLKRFIHECVLSTTHRLAFHRGFFFIRFAPCFARSVGLGPLFFPSKGRFCHRSIHRTEAPVDALQFVVSLKASLPEFSEYPRFIPFLEPAVGGA